MVRNFFLVFLVMTSGVDAQKATPTPIPSGDIVSTKTAETVWKPSVNDVEVPKLEALVLVDITTQTVIQAPTKVYYIDAQDVKTKDIQQSVVVEYKTGRQRVALRDGYFFDERTGKFWRERTNEEQAALFQVRRKTDGTTETMAGK